MEDQSESASLENDSFLEVEGQSEDIEDTPVTEDQFGALTIIHTDWTVSTILDQIERGNIDITPDFQRRDAWNRGLKSKYIESLILGVPVPPIVLAEFPRARGKFAVIDGKQRLLSLIQFFKGTEKPGGGFKKLRLSNLPILSRINGFDEKKLRDTEFHSALENQSVRTNVIRGVKDEDVLYQIFLRLNTGSVKLAAQELRRALHPGPFLNYIDEYCENSPALKVIFKGRIPDFRMRDAELLIRYLGFKTRIDLYEGNLKRFLDGTVADLSSSWGDGGEEHVVKLMASFETAVASTVSIFSDDGCFRFWNGASYERPFNRAIFDVMTYFFSNSDVAESAVQHGASIVDGFKTLCRQDRAFSRHVRLTTKSMEATQHRLNAWEGVLRSQLGDIVPKTPQFFHPDAQ